MHECLSAGRECEREIAISRAKPETIYWLKMSKISDLDNFAIDKISMLQLHVTAEIYAYSYSTFRVWIQWYGGPEGPCPLPISTFPITNFKFSHY